MNQGLANGELLNTYDMGGLTDFRAGDIMSLAQDGREKPGCASERRLYAAVLEEAVFQYKQALKNLQKGRRVFKFDNTVFLWEGVVAELEDWFFGNSAPDWPCSFENICDIVGLDAGWIRAQVRKMRDVVVPGLDT